MEPQHEFPGFVVSAKLHVELIETLKEEAGLFQDAAAVVRQNGEKLVNTLLQNRSPGVLWLGDQEYWIISYKNNMHKFVSFTDTNTIYFNHWENIADTHARAASPFDYAVLLDAYLEGFR